MKTLKIEFRGCANVFHETKKQKNDEVVDLLPDSRIEGLTLYLLGHSLPVSELRTLAPGEIELARSIMSKIIVNNVDLKNLKGQIPVFSQGKLINKTPPQNRGGGSAPFHVFEEMLPDKFWPYWLLVQKHLPDLTLGKIENRGEGGFASFNKSFQWPKGEPKDGKIYEAYVRCAGLEKEDQKDYPTELGKINAIYFNKIFTPGSPENELFKKDRNYFGKTYFINGGNWLKSNLPKLTRIIVRGSMARKFHFDFDIVLGELTDYEYQRLINGPMIGLYSEGSATVCKQGHVDDLVDERETLKVPDIFKRK